MDFIVPVTGHERAAGALMQPTAQAAYQALYTHGCVLLRGAFDPATVAAMRAEFLDQSPGDAATMAARAAEPPPNTLLNVGANRYEIALKLKGPFASPQVLANPLLCRFLIPALGQTLKLSGVTVVVSYPGATMQHFHRDHGLLYDGPAGEARMPPHAINCAVPLIDVDKQTGPTGVCLGSHFWPAARQPTPQDLTVVPFQIGDVFLLDYRTYHAGMANTGTLTRPIAYLVYARTWFFDEVNHVARTPLNMSLDDFNALSKEVQPLLSRVYAQHMRARFLNGR
ncbi:MAG: phytanoyl-CoA dioxygenase family protein [Alphaproteobacteria bacterium]|nr:phytanoyl-CoA dioxygenase family protein [Alphaproteobacteria bacterium]MBV9904509.1 phytanoyl-CoA dioxygenase family protein [Alphaproteobacteria bacterium]